MKKLSNLKGVKILDRETQKSVTGGGMFCTYRPNGYPCAGTRICCYGKCVEIPVKGGKGICEGGIE